MRTADPIKLKTRPNTGHLPQAVREQSSKNGCLEAVLGQQVQAGKLLQVFPETSGLELGRKWESTAPYRACQARTTTSCILRRSGSTCLGNGRIPLWRTF